MPRGGARPGSGPKPRARPFEVIPGGAPAKILEPSDLPAAQLPYWRRYAPLAIERRTLTPATVPAFRLLCELEAERQAVKDTIDRDGRTFLKMTIDASGQAHQELKMHPLKTDYAKLTKQVETLLARFLLAPFGKPLTVAPPKTAAERATSAQRSAFFGVPNV